MSIHKSLLTPVQVGAFNLRNRIVMASMTRSRNLVPNDINVEYYSQRATVGLIITEGILITPQGTEWPDAPGIWNDRQVKGWRKVIDKVHAKGGLIVAQLWHLGRVNHSLHQAGQPPVGPSAV